MANNGVCNEPSLLEQIALAELVVRTQADRCIWASGMILVPAVIASPG